MVKTVLCRGSCTPKKAAQTDAVYKEYCKACFKAKHPKKYAELADRYNNPCRLCGENRELRHEGICTPCTTARSCSSCKEVNEKKRAPHCKHCANASLSSVSRSSSGRPTKQPRLATWCILHGFEWISWIPGVSGVPGLMTGSAGTAMDVLVTCFSKMGGGSGRRGCKNPAQSGVR